MKKKNPKIPNKNEIISALQEFRPIGPDKYLGITRDLSDLFPTGYITSSKMKYILRITQDPDEIADYVLEPYTEKERKKREDAYHRLSDKYRGRPIGKEHDLFKQAFDTIVEINSVQWTVDNILEHYEQYIKSTRYIIDRFIESAYKQVDPCSLGLSVEDVLKADEKLFVLCQVMRLFENKIAEAKESKTNDNTLFLNMVRKVFKEDAHYYVEEYKGKGNKINTTNLHERWKTFWKRSVCTTRHKNTALCYLAYAVHTLFGAPGKAEQMSILKDEAILKIKLLMQKYGISPEEITPPLYAIPYQEIESFLNKLKDI
jgi:hypothetical protein